MWLGLQYVTRFICTVCVFALEPVGGGHISIPIMLLPVLALLQFSTVY